MEAQILSRINAYEIYLTRWILPPDRVLLNGAMIALTRLGDCWLWIGVSLLLIGLDPAGSPRLLLSVGLASGGASLLFMITKRVTGRPRPCEVDPDLHPIISAPDHYSFPSGHAINAFALTTALEGFVPEPGIYLLYLLAFGIAVSRVHLRLHYPTDVLAGAILGYLIGSAVRLLI
jgi:undecaprenyl-diphosphatase